MRRSGDTLRDGEVLTADVAIVGAGPIGIVAALELADAGHRVLLVESGGDKRDPRADALGDSASQDPYHVAKRLAVRRGVGGTSALWGGRCLPFDPIDLEARPAVPEDLWPVSHDEIAPYFGRACDWFVCGKPVFNAKDLPELADRDMIPGLADGDVCTNDLERWSLPTRFGALYGKRLDAHPRIDLVTNLTCTEIVQDESCAVDHLVLKTLGGVSVTARAGAHILAAGGLECTRLLMASRGRSPDGIGGDSGHLGRWYMAHVEAKVAEMHLSTPPDQTIYSHELDADGVYVRRRFTFSRELQHREPIPNGAAWFVNPPLADHRHGSGILSGVYLTLISPIGGKLLAEGIRRAGTKAVRSTSVRAHLRNIMRDLIPAAKFAVTFTYQRFLRRGRKAPGFFVRSAANVHPLQYHGEHRPHWESHVALSSEVDMLGMPRLDVQLVFDDEDVASVARALQLIDRQVRDAGVGHVEYLHDDLDAAVREYLMETTGYHQTGTTRMSRDPEQGVVDRDLTVWGAPNLFVASTSVLPTSSQANPTFMGVAFALRLTDMLDRRLRECSPGSRGASPADADNTSAQHPPAVGSGAVPPNPDALFITWTPEWRTERLAEGFGANSLLPAPFARKWPWPVRYLTQAIATTWHLARRRPQLVSFQNPPALTGLVLVLLSRVLRFDVWADCHSGPWMDPRWMRFDRLNRWVLARCRGGLFHNLEMLAEHGHETPEAILSWTPPLRDLHDPASAAAAARADPYVVVVCSYHPDEPTEEVLAAARLMPDVPLKLTGSAPDEFRADAPDNVTFTGFLSVPDYWKLVQGAATILCLTKYPKTMQQGIAEGLEAGVFGVSSDTQTMRDWRAGTETCDLVDWRDPAAIADALRAGVQRNGSYDHTGRERLLARSHEQFQAFVDAAQTAARR